jgi:hypothetical protein
MCLPVMRCERASRIIPGTVEDIRQPPTDNSRLNLATTSPPPLKNSPYPLNLPLLFSTHASTHPKTINPKCKILFQSQPSPPLQPTHPTQGKGSTHITTTNTHPPLILHPKSSASRYTYSPPVPPVRASLPKSTSSSHAKPTPRRTTAHSSKNQSHLITCRSAGR